MKEVPNNLDMTTGMLGLTDKEEDQIVAFLETLTDGLRRLTHTLYGAETSASLSRPSLKT